MPGRVVFWLLLFGCLAFYLLAVVGAVQAGGYGEAVQVAVQLAVFLAVAVTPFTIMLRIRLHATATELILCNGLGTVRMPWSEVQLCAALLCREGTPVVALGEDDELVVTGRVGHVRETNPVLLETVLPVLKQYGLVVHVNGLRPIPIGDVWGARQARRKTRGLLVVRTDGRAYLSIAAARAATRDATAGRSLQLLRDLEAVRTGIPRRTPD